VLQGLLAQFPTQIYSENVGKNREFRTETGNPTVICNVKQLRAHGAAPECRYDFKPELARTDGKSQGHRNLRFRYRNGNVLPFFMTSLKTRT
jgi:hypothetical protein